ncbi:uncharacterized protein LOC124290425 [Haliotis rubra]|uniref:uncharacterized protein LOC124290425 n=1 Tax=Haliotis rubra TaxID=36100 RepID=UPI001EE54247|nr:uncharacterized protein LOC124290425 [Haliotis rubra]
MSHRFFEGAKHAKIYAVARPRYSDKVLDLIFKFCQAGGGKFKLAVDVACGTGHQSTLPLVGRFEKVIGLDVSEQQLKQAPKNVANLEFRQSTAENLSFLDPNSVDLVTAASSLHWFNIQEFYREVERVLSPGGCLAVYTYGWATLREPGAQEILEKFISTYLADFFHAGNLMAIGGYKDVKLPFEDSQRNSSTKHNIESTLHVHLVRIQGINSQLDYRSFSRFQTTAAMPRLTRDQRQQAIGRLHAGQRATVIANDFNCSVRTIERLRQRFNTTNSTDDRPRSGRTLVTIRRQDRQIVRHHLQDRFNMATETARNTIGTHQRAISDRTVRRRLQARNLCSLSPDLNPIEHLWDEIQRCLNDIRPRPTTADQLRTAFLRVWARIPMAYVNRLVHSMVRRLFLRFKTLCTEPVTPEEMMANSLDKARRPTNLPDKDALKILKDYIRSELTRLCYNKPFHVKKYTWLRSLVVARLTLYNGRRGDEPSRLLVKEWEDAIDGTWIPAHQVEDVEDEAEKYLIGQFRLAYLHVMPIKT